MARLREEEKIVVLKAEIQLHTETTITVRRKFIKNYTSNLDYRETEMRWGEQLLGGIRPIIFALGISNVAYIDFHVEEYRKGVELETGDKMSIGDYQRHVLNLFRHGLPDREQWDELAEVVLAASENGATPEIDKRIFSVEPKDVLPTE